jgi:hypothetical protein
LNLNGGDVLDAGFAQARGDGLSCFAEADKTKRELAVSHFLLRFGARRS